MSGVPGIEFAKAAPRHQRPVGGLSLQDALRFPRGIEVLASALGVQISCLRRGRHCARLARHVCHNGRGFGAESVCRNAPGIHIPSERGVDDVVVDGSLGQRGSSTVLAASQGDRQHLQASFQPLGADKFCAVGSRACPTTRAWLRHFRLPRRAPTSKRLCKATGRSPP